MKQPRYTLTLTDLTLGDVLTLRTAARHSPFRCQAHALKVLDKAAGAVWESHVRRCCAKDKRAKSR